MDRASVYETEDRKPQTPNNQEVTKHTKSVLSSCLAFSVSETIEKHPELGQVINIWPELLDHITQIIETLVGSVAIKSEEISP